MRNHRAYHLLRPSRAAEPFVRGSHSSLHQAGSSVARHSFSVLGTLAPLLTLALAVLLLVLVWRVWGRRGLAMEGRFLEVRLGEQVSRAAVESLMSRLAGGLPRPLFGPAPWVARWDAQDGLVFAEPASGEVLRRGALMRRYRRALRAAKIDPRRFHDLRHTFGTAMAAAGVPMRTLQEWMGHRDIATTQRYADYAPNEREVEMVDRAFCNRNRE